MLRPEVQALLRKGPVALGVSPRDAQHSQERTPSGSCVRVAGWPLQCRLPGGIPARQEVVPLERCQLLPELEAFLQPACVDGDRSRWPAGALGPVGLPRWSLCASASRSGPRPGRGDRTARASSCRRSGVFPEAQPCHTSQVRGQGPVAHRNFEGGKDCDWEAWCPPRGRLALRCLQSRGVHGLQGVWPLAETIAVLDTCCLFHPSQGPQDAVRHAGSAGLVAALARR